MVDKNTEIKHMEKTYSKPMDDSWYQQIALPVSWRLVHGRLAGKKVLDIGAGNGWISYLAQEEGAAILATDIFLTALPDYIPHQYADKENLPFGNEQFDFVITANTLHHGDLKRTVSEVYRVLKKGGEFVSFQEPCIRNEADEKDYLEHHCREELDLGIDEHRPSFQKYKDAFNLFSSVSFYVMNETVWKEKKQPLLLPLTENNYEGGIAIRAIKI